MQSGRTYLRPHHLRQRADELGRRVYAELKGFFVDDLADGVPEGGFEALVGVRGVMLWDWRVGDGRDGRGGEGARVEGRGRGVSEEMGNGEGSLGYIGRTSSRPSSVLSAMLYERGSGVVSHGESVALVRVD